MSTPLYSFTNGWQIERLLRSEIDEISTGTEFFSSRPYSFFGLRNPQGGLTSIMYGEIYPDGYIDFAQPAMKVKSLPSSEGMGSAVMRQRAWRTFFSEMTSLDMRRCMDEAIGVSDLLSERIHDADIKARAIMAKMHESFADHIDGIYAGARLVESIFTDLLDEDRKAAFEIVKPQKSPRGRAYIYFKNVNHLLVFEMYLDGWSLSNGDRLTPDIDIRADTLSDVWREYVNKMFAFGFVLVPLGKLDAWWEENTLDGAPLFDVEPYFLVNTRSPVLWEDERFMAWVKSQQ